MWYDIPETKEVYMKFFRKAFFVLFRAAMVLFAEAGVSYLWLRFLPPHDVYLALALVGGFVITLRLGVIALFLALNADALGFAFAQFRREQKCSQSLPVDCGLPWLAP